MKDMNTKLYVVTTAIKFEGRMGQWVFADLKGAAGKYQDIVTGIDEAGETCDTVTLTGPFRLGDNLNSSVGIVLCRHDFDLFREIEQEEIDNQAD